MNLNKNMDIAVYNEIGEMVYGQKIKDRLLSINTKNWSRGIYILSIRVAGVSVFTNKVIKQ